MGKLISEIRSHGRNSKRSMLDDFKDQMSDSDYKDLLDAIADIAIPISAIGKVLRSRGIKISDGTIYKWRTTNANQ